MIKSSSNNSCAAEFDEDVTSTFGVSSKTTELLQSKLSVSVKASDDCVTSTLCTGCSDQMSSSITDSSK